MADTTRDWQQWGRHDPFYAVASLPERHRDGANPWTAEDFYAHGAETWSEIAPLWRGYAGEPSGTVLEIGCGAGRMSRQLAEAFDAIVALDVSQDQLDLARAAVAETSTPGRFRISTGDSLAADAGEANAVFSTHVFQHLPPKLAGELLTDCGRVLAPGGTAMLHLPIPGSNGTGTYLSDVARRWRELAPVRAWGRRIAHRLGRGVPPMRFQAFDPAWVFERLQAGGLDGLELHVVPVSGQLHAFFMARKPAA
jgi:SAM-dependent methyltransferase